MTTTPADAGLRGRRILLLVGLFFLTLPGWVVGIYLILRWTGLIRGMSRDNEVAAAWAIVALVVSVLALATLSVLTIGPDPTGRANADAGAAQRPLWLGVGALAAIATFLLVRTRGAPRLPSLVENPDWRGFAVGTVVAIAAIGFSVSSYEEATSGGGTYLIAWGAALWGGYKALRSLRRPGRTSTKSQPPS